MSTAALRRARWMLLTAAVVALTVSPASAATVKSATVLTVERLAPVAWGQRATVTAHLRLTSGAPLGDYHVSLHLAGTIAGGRTDAAGTAVFDVKTPVNPGDYPFQMTFNGTTTLMPSAASGTLTVEPRYFTVHTVPANPGLPFSFNGTQFKSDAQGIASIQVSPTFDSTLRPAAGNLAVAPGVEERFARWRTHNGDIYATYEMYYQVSLKFVDLGGRPVDSVRVTKVDLKSAIGDFLSVPSAKPFTVLGQRVVPLAGELEAKDVTYAAEDVVVDGASVVHVAQQRFTPSKERVWTITLLFYSAHISVRDALFGFPLDTSVAITYPDGHVVDLPAKNGELSLSSLARGDYRVAAHGWGISFSRPVSLSRDQEVALQFISYLDLGVALALLLLIVIGLVILGRPGMAQAMRDALRGRGAPVPAGAAMATTPLAGAVANGPGMARAVASGVAAPSFVGSSISGKGTKRPRARATRMPKDEPMGLSEAEATGVSEGEATGVSEAEATGVSDAEATGASGAEGTGVSGAEGTVAAEAEATPLPEPPAVRAPRADPLRVPRTYVVQPGDTIRSIAAEMLGNENAWPEIFHANASVLFDPDMIRPGTRIKIP